MNKHLLKTSLDPLAAITKIKSTLGHFDICLDSCELAASRETWLTPIFLGLEEIPSYWEPSAVLLDWSMQSLPQEDLRTTVLDRLHDEIAQRRVYHVVVLERACLKRTWLELPPWLELPHLVITYLPGVISHASLLKDAFGQSLASPDASSYLSDPF